MYMANNLIMSMTNAASKPTVVSGSASAVSPSGAGNEFQSLMVHVIGSESASPSSLPMDSDNASLLPALLFNRIAAVLSDKLLSEESIVEENALQLPVAVLTDHEDLSELLDREDMQEWLIQASLLLQGMELLPQHPNTQQQHAADAAAVTLSSSNNHLTMEQAKLILQAFPVTTDGQSNDVFVNQLLEKLNTLLSAKQTTSPVITQTAAEAALPELSSADKGNIQWTVSTSAADKLGVLAAKFMPLNVLQLTPDQQSNVSSDQALSLQIAGTDQAQQSALTVESSPIIPEKLVNQTETTVRSYLLAEDLSKFVTGKLQFLTNNGLTEARLTLIPETLGQVNVKLSMQNGQLVAQFAAQTAMGKEALEAQASQLRATLQNQGIQVEKIEISHSSSLQSGMFQEQREQQQNRQFEHSREEHTGEGLEEYATEAAVLRNMLQQFERNGFEATA